MAGISKRKHNEEIIKRVEDKLSSIRQQRDAILASVQSMVDDIVIEAEESASCLVKERDKHKFRQLMMPTLTKLEESWNKLFLIQDSLQGDDGDDNQTSDSEPEVIDDTQSGSLNSFSSEGKSHSSSTQCNPTAEPNTVSSGVTRTPSVSPSLSCDPSVDVSQSCDLHTHDDCFSDNSRTVAMSDRPVERPILSHCSMSSGENEKDSPVEPVSGMGDKDKEQANYTTDTPPVQPAEPPVQPAEPPVQPAELPVQPAEPPVQPAEPCVHPAEPRVQPAEPPVHPAEPHIQPAELPVKPAKSRVQPTEPRVQPAEPRVQPAEPRVQTAEPPVQPAEPRVQPAELRVQPAEPHVQPAEPRVQPAEPRVQPAEPRVKPSKPGIPPAESPVQLSESRVQLSESRVQPAASADALHVDPEAAKVEPTTRSVALDQDSGVCAESDCSHASEGQLPLVASPDNVTPVQEIPNNNPLIKDSKLSADKHLHSEDTASRDAFDQSESGKVEEDAYGLGPMIDRIAILEGSHIEVFITKVCHVSKFWVQPFNPLLEDLMDELALYNERLKPGDPGWTLPGRPRIGMVVTARYSADGCWYRARVVAVKRSTGEQAGAAFEAEVLYVDYGYQEWLTTTDIRPLAAGLAALPCHAFLCALAQTATLAGDINWAPPIVNEFVRTVHRYSRFHAALSVVPGCPLYFAELYSVQMPLPLMSPLTSTQSEVSVMLSVSESLVRAGRARAADNETIARLYDVVMSYGPRDAGTGSSCALRESDVHVMQSPRLLQSSDAIRVGPGTLGTAPGVPPYHVVVSTASAGSLRDPDSTERDYASSGQGVDNAQAAQEMYDDKVPHGPVAKERVQVKLNGRQGSREGGDTQAKEIHSSQSSHSDSGRRRRKNKSSEQKGTKKTGSSTKANSNTTRETGKGCESPAGQDAIVKVKLEPGTELTVKQEHAQEAVQGVGDEGCGVRNGMAWSKSQDRLQNMGLPARLPAECGSSSPREHLTETRTNRDSRQTNVTSGVGTASDVKIALDVVTSGNAKSDDVTSCRSNTSGSNLRESRETAATPTGATRSRTSDQGMADPLPDASRAAADGVRGRRGEAAEGATPSDGAIDTGRNPEGPNAGEATSPDCQYPMPEVIPEDDGCVHFMMAYIESPGLFWIHVVSPEAQRSVMELKQAMNDHYAKANKAKLQREFSAREVTLDSACCAQYSGDGSYYRGRVIGLRHELEETSVARRCSPSPQQRKRIAEVQVLYVDFGGCEWLSVKKLYPLPAHLAGIPPQAVCCTLAGLVPLCDTYEGSQGPGADPGPPGQTPRWRLDAERDFVRMAGYDKHLIGYIAGAKAGQKLRPQDGDPLRLVVVDTSGSSDVWINEEMIRKGYAACSSDIIVAQHNYNIPPPSAAEPSLETATWNPMAEDFLSERNSYHVDVDDPEVALTGYKSKDESRVCFNYNRGGCRRENCPYFHTRTDGNVTSDRKAVLFAKDVEHLVAAPEVDTWVAVEVSAILSPGHFYVTFPFGPRPVLDLIQEEKARPDNHDDGYEGMTSLYRLAEALDDHYKFVSSHRDTDLTMYATGELVVARCAQDDRWYRAKVTNADPDQFRVQVFYVDFGNTAWVAESMIRQMEAKFMHLPFQAVECFLPLDPAASGGLWSDQARSFFVELVDGKVLFARVLGRGVNGILTLDLYDTTKEEELNVTRVLVEKGFARKPGVTPSGRTATPGSRSRSSSESRSSPGLRLVPG